jgi:hypothetical protein
MPEPVARPLSQRAAATEVVPTREELVTAS